MSNSKVQIKKGKKMPRTKSNDFTRTVKFFNDSFDLEEKSVSGAVTVFATYEEALQAYGIEKALEAINNDSRAKQIEAKIAAETKGLEERFILAFIKPMRQMAPFSAMAATQKEKPTADEVKEQTKGILDQVKAVPFLLDGLMSFCANRAAEGDED